MNATARRTAAYVALMPGVFVLLWSSGFVVARLGMPHAPPLSFLALRFALSVLVFAVWVAWSGAKFPTDRGQWAHLAVVGMLLQAGYLGGIWAAVKLGMGAGTSALIAGLQPVLTALWVAWGSRTPQRVAPRQWLGLVLGFGGLLLVVYDKLGIGEITPLNLLICVGALLAITVGTLYQKRWVRPCDVRTANLVQLCAAFAVMLPLSLFETEPIRPAPELIIAMVWSVIALTLGASSLLYLLIQRGAATHVASLMYLVPPCTALLAWLLFDEPLTVVVLLGLGATAVGVALVVRVPMAAPADRPPAR